MSAGSGRRQRGGDETIDSEGDDSLEFSQTSESPKVGPSSRHRLLHPHIQDETRSGRITQSSIVSLLRALPAAYLGSFKYPPRLLNVPSLCDPFCKHEKSLNSTAIAKPPYLPSLGKKRSFPPPWAVPNGHLPVRLYRRLLFECEGPQFHRRAAASRDQAAESKLALLEVFWKNSGQVNRANALRVLRDSVKEQMQAPENKRFNVDAVLTLLTLLADYASHSKVAAMTAVKTVQGCSHLAAELVTPEIHAGALIETERQAQRLLVTHLRRRKQFAETHAVLMSEPLQLIPPIAVSKFKAAQVDVSPWGQLAPAESCSEDLDEGFMADFGTEETYHALPDLLHARVAYSVVNDVRLPHSREGTKDARQGSFAANYKSPSTQPSLDLPQLENPFASALRLARKPEGEVLVAPPSRSPLLLPTILAAAQDVALASDSTLQVELYRSRTEADYETSVRPKTSLLPPIPSLPMRESSMVKDTEHTPNALSSPSSDTALGAHWVVLTQAWRLLQTLPIDRFPFPSQTAVSILRNSAECQETRVMPSQGKLNLEVAKFELLRYRNLHGYDVHAFSSLPALLQQELIRRSIVTRVAVEDMNNRLFITVSEQAWIAALLAVLSGQSTPGFIQWSTERLAYQVTGSQNETRFEPSRAEHMAMRISARHLPRCVREELERRTSAITPRDYSNCPLCSQSSSMCAASCAPRIPGHSTSTMVGLLAPVLEAASVLTRLERWAKARLTPSSPSTSHLLTSLADKLVRIANELAVSASTAGTLRTEVDSVACYLRALQLSQGPVVNESARKLRAKVGLSRDLSGDVYRDLIMSRFLTHSWSRAIVDSLRIAISTRLGDAAKWLSGFVEIMLDAVARETQESVVAMSDASAEDVSMNTVQTSLARQLTTYLIDAFANAPDWHETSDDLGDLGRFASEASVGQVAASFSNALLMEISSVRRRAVQIIEEIQLSRPKSDRRVEADGSSSSGSSLLSVVAALRPVFHQVGKLAEITCHDSGALRQLPNRAPVPAIGMQIRGLSGGKGSWQCDTDIPILSMLALWKSVNNLSWTRSSTFDNIALDESQSVLQETCSSCLTSTVVALVPGASASTTSIPSSIFELVKATNRISILLQETWYEALELARINTCIRLPSQAGHLLSWLFENGSRSGQLFAAAYEPYRKMLESWIFSGRLVDPYGEFLLYQVHREPASVRGTLTQGELKPAQVDVKGVVKATLITADGTAVTEVKSLEELDVAVDEALRSPQKSPRAAQGVAMQHKARYRIFTERSNAPVPSFLQGIEDVILTAGQGLAILARASAPIYAAALSDAPPDAEIIESYFEVRDELFQAKRGKLLPVIPPRVIELLSKSSEESSASGSDQPQHASSLQRLLALPSLSATAQASYLDSLQDPGPESSFVALASLLLQENWDFDVVQNNHGQGQQPPETPVQPLAFTADEHLASQQYQQALQRRQFVIQHLVSTSFVPWLVLGLTEFQQRVRLQRRRALQSMADRAALLQAEQEEERQKQTRARIARMDRLAEISLAKSRRALLAAKEKAADRLRILSWSQDNARMMEYAYAEAQQQLLTMEEEMNHYNARLQWRMLRLSRGMERAELLERDSKQWEVELKEALTRADGNVSEDQTHAGRGIEDAIHRRQRWNMEESQILPLEPSQPEDAELPAQEPAMDQAEHTQQVDMTGLQAVDELPPSLGDFSDVELTAESSLEVVAGENEDQGMNTTSPMVDDEGIDTQQDMPHVPMSTEIQPRKAMPSHPPRNLDWKSAVQQCIVKPIKLHAETVSALCVHLLVVQNQLPAHLASLRAHLLLRSERFGVLLARELVKLARMEGLSGMLLARKAMPRRSGRQRSLRFIVQPLSTSQHADVGRRFARLSLGAAIPLDLLMETEDTLQDVELESVLASLEVPKPLQYSKKSTMAGDDRTTHAMLFEESDGSDDEEEPELGVKPNREEIRKHYLWQHRRDCRLEDALILAYAAKTREALPESRGLQTPRKTNGEQASTMRELTRFLSTKFGVTSVPVALPTDLERLMNALEAARAVQSSPHVPAESTSLGFPLKTLEDEAKEVHLFAPSSGFSSRLFFTVNEEKVSTRNPAVEWWGQGNRYVPTSGQPIDIFDHLCLGYTAKWPLSLVISQTVVSRAYQPIWRFRMRILTTRLRLDDLAGQIRSLYRRELACGDPKGDHKVFSRNSYDSALNLVKALAGFTEIRDTLRGATQELQRLPPVNLASISLSGKDTLDMVKTSEGAMIQLYLDAISPVSDGESEQSLSLATKPSSEQGELWEGASACVRLARLWSGWGGLYTTAQTARADGAWWWRPWSSQPQQIVNAFRAWKLSTPTERLKRRFIPLVLSFDDDDIVEAKEQYFTDPSLSDHDPELQALYNTFDADGSTTSDFGRIMTKDDHDTYLFELVFARPRRRLQMLLAQIDAQAGIDKLPRTLDACRSEIRRVVTAFEDYAVNSVLNHAWDELLSDLDVSRTPEAVVEAHEKYARSLLAGMFLGGRSTRTSSLINNCLTNASQFVTLTSDAIFAANRLLHAPWMYPFDSSQPTSLTVLERDRLRYARLIALKTAFRNLIEHYVPQTMSSFQQSILALVRALRLATGPDDEPASPMFTTLSSASRSAAASLLYKLDFNNFYSLKTTTSAGLPRLESMSSPSATPRRAAATGRAPLFSTTPAPHFGASIPTRARDKARRDSFGDGRAGVDVTANASNSDPSEIVDPGYTPLRPIRQSKS